MSKEIHELQCQICNRIFKTERDFLQGTSRWRVCGVQDLWFDCSCGALLVLKKGQYPWFTPDLGMSDEAKSVFNSMASLKKIPYLPHSIMRLQQLILQDNVTSHQLAEAAKHEPIIAGNVLNIANRLTEARGSSVIKSLEHAISYVGIKAFSDLIVMASIQSISLNCKVFSCYQYWKDSFLLGRIAEKLARELAPAVLPDEAYISGTLCNIGKLVTAICMPEVADQFVTSEADPNKLQLWTVSESQQGSPSHRVLGEIAGSLWGFPECAIAAIRYHHNLHPNVDKKYIRLVEIVTFANQLAHWLNLMPSRIDAVLLKATAAKFGFTTDRALETFVDTIMPLAHMK